MRRCAQRQACSDAACMRKRAVQCVADSESEKLSQENSTIAACSVATCIFIARADPAVAFAATAAAVSFPGYICARLLVSSGVRRFVALPRRSAGEIDARDGVLRVFSNSSKCASAIACWSGSPAPYLRLTASSRFVFSRAPSELSRYITLGTREHAPTSFRYLSSKLVPGVGETASEPVLEDERSPRGEGMAAVRT